MVIGLSLCRNMYDLAVSCFVALRLCKAAIARDISQNRRIYDVV